MKKEEGGGAGKERELIKGHPDGGPGRRAGPGPQVLLPLARRSCPRDQPPHVQITASLGQQRARRSPGAVGNLQPAAPPSAGLEPLLSSKRLELLQVLVSWPCAPFGDHADDRWHPGGQGLLCP